MDFSHLTQGLDLPRNAFSQQQLLDLYTSGAGDPHADPTFFDWGVGLDVAGIPGQGAPHPGGPGLQHMGVPPPPFGMPSGLGQFPAGPGPGYLGVPPVPDTKPMLGRHGQSPSPSSAQPTPLPNTGSGTYSGASHHNKAISDTGSEKDIKPQKRKASRKSKADKDKDAGQAGKEKQFYNYYHTTYSLRQYLSDNLSDQQVDDLEEMAKCIYEAQLEALLPLDYKDLCFLEEVVTRQAQFYETFLDMVGTPGAVWRRTGDILACNDNFAELLKTTREELVGVNIVKLAAPEALYEAVKLYILKLSLPGLPRQLVSDTALLRRSDNQRLYFRAFVTIVHNMYQMPSVLVGLFFPYPSPGVNSDNILILP